MIDSRRALDVPSAVGHIDPSFNPPLDVSFFRHMPTPDQHLAIAAGNANIMLDYGFTSVYSAGSLTRSRPRCACGSRSLRVKCRARECARRRLSGTTTQSRWARTDQSLKRPARTAFREFIAEQAAIGFDSVKLLMSNDDVFTEGGSLITQYSPEEARAAGEQARESGVWLNCHAQAPESIKLAVRNGFRSVYHCTYADAEAIDLLEEYKDSIFLSPAVGIMWANVYEGAEYGIDTAMAEKMGSVKALQAMTELYPELRKRGLRVLPGGDYGFPNNPIGRNARDLELFVRLFGYSPAEALRATTQYGGQVMDLPVGLLAPGYFGDVLVVRGDPTADVSVLQDTDNLLAIMQNGTFYKLADKLAPA